MQRKSKIKKFSKNELGQQGFTLIEILVALLLVVLVLTMVSGGGYSNRDNLEDIISNLERAVRFSGDEAALRNTVMRVRIKFDDEPQKYSVEFGPGSDFTLKRSFKTTVKKAKTSDEKAAEKAKKERDKQFNSVKEFSEGPREIHENVRIIGFGSSLFESFVTETDGAIYIYPSGEKDAAIIILATEDEIATMVFNPFTSDIKVRYFPLDQDIDYDDLIEKQDEIALEYYKEWMNKK